MWVQGVFHFLFFLFASPFIFWIAINVMQLLDNLKFMNPSSTHQQKLYFGAILVLAFWSLFFLTL